MSRDRLHVVIAGGGVAAVETLLALRELAGQRVEITLLSPEREFLYRPVTVAEAFERGEARTYALAEILANRGGGRLVWDSLASVEPDEHVAVTGQGERNASTFSSLRPGRSRVIRCPGHSPSEVGATSTRSALYWATWLTAARGRSR